MGLGGLRILTAGESHGPGELCVVAGVPAGMPLTADDIDRDLCRRQHGYGRGGRMRIESDQVRILSGVRLGRCLGSPISLLVENVDHGNWLPVMSPSPSEASPPSRVTVPRPGHADLGGVAKTGSMDIRDVLERSSARETVGRVAAGAVAKAVLREVGVTVRGRVIAVGGVRSELVADPLDPASVDWEAVEASSFGTDDAARDVEMREAVDGARDVGESLGGVFEIWAWGLCPGVGGYATPEERLDGRLMGAVGSVPAVKGVEIGLGFASADLVGSQVHDAIVPAADPAGRSHGLTRGSNRAGGLEGGMTTGLPLVIRAAMKPIPTLTRPLPSVDLATGQVAPAHKERSDVEAVAAARVVGEAMVAWVLASAYLEKFGGDAVQDLHASFAAYAERLAERGIWQR